MIADARRQEDEAAVTRHARELRELRRNEMAIADEQIYIPAVMRLSPQSQQKGGSCKDIEALGFEPTSRAAQQAGQSAAGWPKPSGSAFRKSSTAPF